ncbi:hypothetical protein [Bradyrhizobium sp.]|uniref:hypothetical protein n=1 Tax=Bradyrhizobium sp. TaxID=376 RepID=UPI0025BC3B1C|nr:hypothetical protein [Bradyrhizobium sp.]MBV8918563.1 hypothetical protein [Bradyrhizobium sp.]
MLRFLVVVVFYGTVFGGLRTEAAFTGEVSEAPAGTVWTVLIPDAFPRFVYTWHFNADGSYAEDGHDAATDRPIQSTLHGHWSREGSHMILRQDGLPYVFDGVVLGDLYAGTMTFDGRASSRFCAARGEQPPDHCNPPQGIAAI